MTEAERDSTGITGQERWWTVAGIAIVSLIYFADIFLRARAKWLWADELFTVYLCRLPTFRGTWEAVAHGADFNPPLFYLLIRGANHLFGEGPIATRLPSIVGFWIFGLCLFVFAARRLGPTAGFIAGVFPFFTVAQYYAYEARPHGVVLGWCGLALVCWQMAEEARGRYWWLAGFAISLIGALTTHVYAFYLLCPFVAVALYDFLKKRRLDWGVLGTVAISVLLVIPIYLRLLRNYKSMNFFGGLASHPQDVLQGFFVAVVGPSVVVLLFAIVSIALPWNRQDQAPGGPPQVPQRELLMALMLGAICLIGVLGVRLSHGPYFDRYFLCSVAGYALLLAYSTRSRRKGATVASVLATFMFLLLLGHLAIAIQHRKDGAYALHEPVSGFEFSSLKDGPLARNEAVSGQHDNLDILILEELDYIYLFRYDSPEMVSHLYYGAPTEGETFIRAYDRLGKWAHLDIKTTTFASFFTTHQRFKVYATGNYTSACGQCIQNFLDAGYVLKSAHTDSSGTLYEYGK